MVLFSKIRELDHSIRECEISLIHGSVNELSMRSPLGIVAISLFIPFFFLIEVGCILQTSRLQ